MAAFGRQQGIRRHQRYGQQALDLGVRTLDERFSLDEDDDDEERALLASIVTCQTCGAYWDGRYFKTCPCGGSLG